jgi:DNA polymerase I-like protein with 3'-5' exonuclease and polymerase domains
MKTRSFNNFVRVRLGTKSTIEESRIERFIGIGGRNKGKLPIPLKYYGAHTGRWAGSDKVNFQNLPARDKKKKALKNAVIAPEGHKLLTLTHHRLRLEY